MNRRIFQAPGRYIQGRGVLAELPHYIDEFGGRGLVLLTSGSAARLEYIWASSKDGSLIQAPFSGECSMAEIMRISTLAQQHNCHVVVGIGGGKVLDTAKAAAHFAQLPVLIAPTVASSDAPCSALSVVYQEESGALDQLLQLRRNPDLILVDSAVIASAPPRLFSAGIGDALATYFEMKACWEAHFPSFIQGEISLAAYAIARQCRDTLLADGRKAYTAVKKKLCTRSVEHVIEANTLLSGIGFECGGTCGAHPINNGLAALEANRITYHGEKVAFALLCQLVLMNEGLPQIQDIQSFLHAVDLPVTLEELGIQGATLETLAPAATIACSDPSIRALSPQITEADVAHAILAADALGQAFLSGLAV